MFNIRCCIFYLLSVSQKDRLRVLIFIMSKVYAGRAISALIQIGTGFQMSIPLDGAQLLHGCMTLCALNPGRKYTITPLVEKKIFKLSR
jgi:hypothetical protein